MSKPADDKNKQSQGQQADAGAPPAASSASANPVSDNSPPDPLPPNGEKKRVRCDALKGKKIIIGNGQAVQIDENGFFEVDAKEAERLLTIPGYKKA